MIVIERFIFVSFKPGGGVARSASDIKDMLLKWCRAKTKEYEVLFDHNLDSIRDQIE
jgi:hypothetical protein